LCLRGVLESGIAVSEAVCMTDVLDSYYKPVSSHLNLLLRMTNYFLFPRTNNSGIFQPRINMKLCLLFFRIRGKIPWTGNRHIPRYSVNDYISVI
jgi:hypothetical protein